MQTYFKKDKNTLMFEREEVYNSTLKYFNGDTIATDVWINKYALKDSDGNLYEQNPDDMHLRLAKELARIEKKYPNPLTEEQIFSLLKDFKYIIPQGGSMAGIGNNRQVAVLSNCYVIGEPKWDSYGSICKIDQELVQISKRRGGIGTDLTGLRPTKSAVNNSALNSTGIVPFAERYSNSIREVAQDGRRGALMLTLSIEHPDAEDFVDAKMKSGKITGANISVKVSDKFMKAVIDEKEFTQQFPVNSKTPIVTKNIDAKKLWDKIIYNAWKSAEPGLLFWDNILKESPADCYADVGFETVSVNPCGELPLCVSGSCILLVLNLYNYVIYPFTNNAKFNYHLFKEHINIAQKLLDDIVDLELEKLDVVINKIKNDPEEKSIKAIELQLWKNIKTILIQGRRTGLGITAEGDMLAALGYTYGTREATNFAANVAKTLAIESYRSSAIMADERGVFPIYDKEKEKNNPFINRIKKASSDLTKLIENNGRRNIANLTIAPTGSVSICTQTTSGIEPVFRPIYKRRRKINPNDKSVTIDFIDQSGDHWEEYLVVHNHFKTWMNVNNIDGNVEEMDEAELTTLISTSPYHNATSEDIDWKEKVIMQGEIQKWVDHSISVTVNVPKETSVEQVNDIYITAWEYGCKGCTIYRDGSRTGVLIGKNEGKSLNTLIKENNAPRRPKNLECSITRFINDKEQWIGFLGMYVDKETGEKFPYEIFTGLEESFPIPKYVDSGIIIKTKSDDGRNKYDLKYKDKDGYDINVSGLDRAFNKEFWNIGKFISAMLRHRLHMPMIINLVDTINLNGNNGHEIIFGTWQAGIKRILKRYLKEELTDELCPVCSSSNYITKEGCVTCLDCGHSVCG